MAGTPSGPQDATWSPSCEEVALVLQGVICRVGLTPPGLAKHLDSLRPLLAMESVKAQIQTSGGEEAARAVTAVVKEAVGRLDQGPARRAADLLLGVSLLAATKIGDVGDVVRGDIDGQIAA